MCRIRWVLCKRVQLTVYAVSRMEQSGKACDAFELLPC
jgi:hypothetical protein